MGNWVIQIEGVGPHHNKTELDADNITRKLVDELKKSQTVNYAAFFTGSKEGIIGGVIKETI